METNRDLKVPTPVSREQEEVYRVLADIRADLKKMGCPLPEKEE